MKIIDYLAEEEAAIDFQEEVHNALQQASHVKMTEIQKFEYAVYRKECRKSGVEPVLADFLAGDIPDSVVDRMNDVEWTLRNRAMVWAAGR